MSFFPFCLGDERKRKRLIVDWFQPGLLGFFRDRKDSFPYPFTSPFHILKLWNPCLLYTWGLKRYPFWSERYPPVIGLAPLVGKIKTNHFIKLFWVGNVPASAILHEIPALWGDVTRDESQRRFLTQHSVATLLRQCFEWSQHSVPAHYNAGLRRKSSLRIVPCNITLTREKVFFGPTTKKVCKSTRLFIVKKVGLASGCLYWLDQYPAI